MCDLPSEQYWADSSSPLDALVTDLPGFLAAVEALPNADRSQCMAIEPAGPTAFMVFTKPGGARAMLPVMAGADSRVDGRWVDVSEIHAVVLARLAAQRRVTQYPGPGPASARPSP